MPAERPLPKKDEPGFAGSSLWRGLSRSGRGADLVAQGPDLVVVALDALVLRLHDAHHVGRQRLLQRGAVAVHRDVLAALALVQHLLVAVAAQRADDRDPAAVHRAARAAAGLGLAAEPRDQRLQLARAFRAV